MRHGLSTVIGFALCSILLAASSPSPATAVQAQAPAEPELTITMYSSVVEFRTLPTTVVLAELADAQGPKASGEGISDATGLALVQFLPLSGGQDVYVRPGDRVSLARIGARTVVVDVPQLTADVDVAGGRIVGTAPAGVGVRVEATIGNGATLDRTATADGAGSWAIQADLAPGAVSGSATFDDASGHRFIAEFADLTVDVTLEAGAMRGAGTPGTVAMVSIRHENGTEFQAAAAVVEGPSWSATLPIGGVAAGDAVTVTRLGGPAPAAAPLKVTAPDISLEIDPDHDRVTGIGPVGGAMVVQSSSIDGTKVTRSVTASAEGPDAGAFAVDLVGAADLGPGWRVRAAWQAAPQVTVGRLKVIAQALIGVHTSVVRGIAPPGAPITVTLRAEGGAVKAQTPARSDDQGTFAARLGGLLPGVAVTIDSGDSIEVAFLAGDPLVVPVPTLVAMADPNGDMVLGRGQPGSEIQVRILSDPTAPTLKVTVGDDGVFRADFGQAGYDLRRPANGLATVQASGSAMFFTSWAAVQLSTQIGSSNITGYGPPGRAYTVRLMSPDGQVVATSEGNTYDFSDISEIVLLSSLQGYFIAQFEDLTGTPVEVRVGDTLDVVAGDDTVQLTVPLLDGVVFVEDDILAGRTTPDTEVTITVESMTGARATAMETSDATGAFTHDFGDEHDVQFNDSVQLAVVADGHNVTRYVAAPGLVLDFDESSVSGTVAANKALTVSAFRGTDLVARASASSDAAGAFGALLLEEDGTPVELLEGDKIEVRESAAGGEAVSMIAPELVIAADTTTDAVNGRATPGGALVLIVLRQVLDITGFGIGQAWPVIEADGAWTAVPIPTHDVRPGTTIIAQYRLTTGHIALRTHVVPLLAVDHGTPNLCGYAAPRSAVAADLEDQTSAPLASARARTHPNGKYEMVLRDSDGNPVSSAVSQTVRADLTGSPASVTLPEFAISADWAGHTMSGVGPPSTLMLGIFPASRCPSILTDSSALEGVTYAFTSPAGTFAGAPLPTVDPGEGVELAFQTADGHVVFRQLYRSKVRVFVDTDRVDGLTNSMAAVRLVLRDPDGLERASVTTAAGPLGGFDARFPETGGRPSTITAGDVVVLEAAGDRPEITVEPLSFDWSPRNPVAGLAPAGRVVEVQLRLADGRIYALDTTVDGGGRFAFAVGDVPPRASWSLDDVVAVRVILPTAAGHEIVSQTADFEAPTAGAGRKAFLPAVVRRFALAGGSGVLDHADLSVPSARVLDLAAVGRAGTWSDGDPGREWRAFDASAGERALLRSLPAVVSAVAGSGAIRTGP